MGQSMLEFWAEVRETLKQEAKILPVYEKDTICKKCESSCITTRYQNMDVQGCTPAGMKRTCQNCGFIWVEKPLDSEDKL